MEYIDIFAGCGGLSLGLQNSGWKGLFAIEKNKDAFSTLKFNLLNDRSHFSWPEWLAKKEYDINEILKKYSDRLNELKGKVSLVAGGPPCQGFSMAGKRNCKDERNKLVKSYIEFISIVQPESIIFENVHGFTVNFAKNEKGSIKKYSDYVVNKLSELGYNTDFKIINISDYGVPQNRRRFILIAMRNHNPEAVFKILEKNKVNFCKSKGISTTTSVKEALSDLLKTNGVCQSPDSKNFLAGLYGNVNSGYQNLMRQNLTNKNKAVDSHRFVNHSEQIIKLHNDLQKYAPRGKRITPKDNIVENLKRRGVAVLDATSKSPTLTSIPDEIVHYSEPRILTVREYARLQSFPDWYEFKGKYTSGGKRRKQEVPRYTQIGNAVPPLFAEQIGIALKEVLENE